MSLPMLNKQPVTKQESHPDGELMVHEVWDTIQGEGPFQGRRAVFLRLGGCNLTCPLCDTDYTSGNVPCAPSYLSAYINARFGHHKNRIDTPRYNPLLVITGGEPFRQNFGPFARLMLEEGWQIQVETNGTLWQEDVPILPLTVVCSPKTPKLDSNLMPYIKALKYVVQEGEVDPKDGLPTMVLGSKVSPIRPWKGFQGEVWIQPCDTGDLAKNIVNTELAKSIAMKFGYRLGLQLHKILGMP